jgi:hypothetical protein
MRILEEISKLTAQDSFVISFSHISDDKKSVITKCVSNKFPVHDLTSVRTETSRLLYDMQEAENAANSKKLEKRTDTVNDQVKGMLE